MDFRAKNSYFWFLYFKKVWEELATVKDEK